MKVEHAVRDRENGCPLGMKCDACNWYIPLYRKELDGGYVQVFNCAMLQFAQLQADTKDRVMGVQQATESFRNEVLGYGQRARELEAEQRAALEVQDGA